MVQRWNFLRQRSEQNLASLGFPSREWSQFKQAWPRFPTSSSYNRGCRWERNFSNRVASPNLTRSDCRRQWSSQHFFAVDPKGAAHQRHRAGPKSSHSRQRMEQYKPLSPGIFSAPSDHKKRRQLSQYPRGIPSLPGNSWRSADQSTRC